MSPPISEELAMVSKTDPNRPRSLLNVVLQHHFRGEHEEIDLADAVHAMEEAIESTSSNPASERVVFIRNLTILLQHRFVKSGSVSDLNRVIESIQLELHLTPETIADSLEIPPEDIDAQTGPSSRRIPSRLGSGRPGFRHPADILTQLGNWLERRFRNTNAPGNLKSITDLDEAIVAMKQAVNLSKDRPHHLWHIQNLKSALELRLDVTDLNYDLENLIEVVQQEAELTPPYNKAHLLNTLGHLFQERIRRGPLPDLNRAIKSMEEAVQLTVGEPSNLKYLRDLKDALLQRLDILNDVDDLEKVIEILREEVQLVPEGMFVRGRPSRVNRNPFAKYDDEPKRGPKIPRAACLNQLGNLLQRRFESKGSVGHIDQAIEAIKGAVEMTPSDHPDRPNYLDDLSEIYRLRLSVADETYPAIDLCRKAMEASKESVELTPESDPDLVERLLDYSGTYKDLFLASGSTEDINRAVEISESALKLVPEGEETRPMVLFDLSSTYQLRFVRTGSMEDIARCTELAMKSLRLTPTDDPHRVMALVNVAGALHIHYDISGSMDYLNDAIEKVKEAVELNGEGKGDSDSEAEQKLMALSLLGGFLTARFRRTGLLDDVNQAMAVLDQAEKLAAKELPSDRIARPACLGALGISLVSRFSRTQEISDLTEAIDKMREAVSLLHEGLMRTSSLNDLGHSLHARYNATKNKSEHESGDLDEAINVLKEATGWAAAGNYLRPTCLNNLSMSLESRFKRDGNIVDSDQAIECCQEAVTSSSAEHPDRATYLNKLGDALRSRYEETRSEEHFKRCVDSYAESVDLSVAPPHIRITSAITAARLLSDTTLPLKDVSLASDLMTKAVELLPKTSPRTLRRPDQQFTLSQFDGVACDAAALSAKIGQNADEALRLLELGRGVMAGIYFDTRSDIAELEIDLPALAKQFKDLRDVFDSVQTYDVQTSTTQEPKSPQSEITRRYEATKKFESTIEDIRSHLKYKEFLRGPSPSQMRRMAQLGPIVFINISRFGSYAFILTTNGSKALALPMQYADLVLNSDRMLEILRDENLERSARNKSMSELLAWLWKDAIEPILEELGYTGTLQDNQTWPRVWWIPVGRLSMFPIHAAGIGGNTSTLDRVISSYTPSIRALDHARKQIQKQLNSTTKVLMAGMTTTPGKPESDLRYATAEIEAIRNELVRCAVQNAFLNCPTKAQVVDELDRSSVAHFVCHGTAEDDPSQSLLLLADWETDPFTVADMVEMKLDRAQLAYISACHGANNRKLSLLDEAIHMAGACQLAGFPSVIGSLWRIPDKYGPTVAREVYSHMLGTEGELNVQKAAAALHFAIRKLRGMLTRKVARKEITDVMGWALYLHVGV
jgi:CHAT domain-containing protein